MKGLSTVVTAATQAGTLQKRTLEQSVAPELFLGCGMQERLCGKDVRLPRVSHVDKPGPASRKSHRALEYQMPGIPQIRTNLRELCIRDPH